MVPLLMTLGDIWPGFQGFEVEYRKNVGLKDKVTISH